MKNADMPVSPMFNEHGCPQHHSSVLLQEGQVTGLTKRELFAAMAMQGYLANTETLRRAKSAAEAAGVTIDDGIARVSVSIGDALLAELERTA